MVCAAEEAMTECGRGDDGVPVADVLDAVLSLAEAAGTGSHSCPGVGFEGSSGGAFVMLFGIDATG